MEKLMESIRQNGVLTPLILRKKDDFTFEIISGHRRKYACKKLGMQFIPAVVRDISRDEAIIAMVDSNLYRETFLPSEKAKAYKMKMDAMRRKAGRPPKENLSPVATNFSCDTAAEIGAASGDSRDQVFRYLRLNELTPELLEFVDEGKIGMRTAVEISYLEEEEQRDLVDFIDTEEVFPSHAQTRRMREQSKNGELTPNAIQQIMEEEKPNQKEQLKLPMESVERYFSTPTTPKRMKEIIYMALELYFQRERESMHRADDRDER